MMRTQHGFDELVTHGATVVTHHFSALTTARGSKAAVLYWSDNAQVILDYTAQRNEATITAQRCSTCHTPALPSTRPELN